MNHLHTDLVFVFLVISFGVFGIAYKFPTSTSKLTLPVEMLRQFAVVYLSFFKDFRIENAEHVPESGPVILVANHTAVYDPVCLQVACKDRLIRFMEAREYYEQIPLHYVYRTLRVIPVNRTGMDVSSIREAVRELSAGGCVGIFPEGRISTDGELQEARRGVALLALMSNAVVVPAYFQGTLPFSGMIRDFLQFNKVTLRFGPPVRFDDLAGRHRDKECREIALKRIMDAISELRDQSTHPNAA